MDEVDILRTEIESGKQFKTVLQGFDKKEVTDTVTRLMVENADLAQQLDKARAENINLKKQLRDLQREYADYGEKMPMGEIPTAPAVDVDAVKEEVAQEYLAQIEELQAQLQKAQDTAAIAVAKAADAQAESESIKAQTAELQAEAEDARAQAEELQAEAENARAQAEELQAEVESGRAQAEELQAEVESARAQAADMQAEAENARAQAAGMQAEVESARAQAADMQAEAENARAQAAGMQAEVESARAQAADMQAEVESARAQAADMQAAAESARAQAADMQAEVESARAQAADMQAQAADAQAQMADAWAEAENAKARMAEAGRESERAKSDELLHISDEDIENAKPAMDVSSRVIMDTLKSQIARLNEDKRKKSLRIAELEDMLQQEKEEAQEKFVMLNSINTNMIAALQEKIGELSEFTEEWVETYKDADI